MEKFDLAAYLTGADVSACKRMSAAVTAEEIKGWANSL